MNKPFSDIFPNNQLPSTFQQLTCEDLEKYCKVNLCVLSPPKTKDSICQGKISRWIEWRAAPYPAKRHSEYLYVTADAFRDNPPKILVSAVMSTPVDLDSYLRSNPRKYRYTLSGKKALSRGYTAAEISPLKYSCEIWDIIHSSDERQNRSIAPKYWERPADYDFPDYIDYPDISCADICCGVFSSEGQLVAYLLGKRVGHHVQYDEIMGHTLHLENDIMYLLHFHFLRLCCESKIPPKCLNYGPWYSGENAFSPSGGLNKWKRKIGFQPAYLILASC